ncbi:hypothetical protein [Streptomyces sp. NPDC016845]|uniref:hypothetical protein n=1 Tax=Streptomyces sp. NPDC016845 TaxID=3364972 RepID=UPI003792C2E8
MDQGWAAVVAAVFGLVGTVVGGLAAIWGAKVGAERAAQAARQQAVDQAEFERSHWLRQQRLELFAEFLARSREWQKIALASEKAFESPESRENYREEMAGISDLFSRLILITDQVDVVCPGMTTIHIAYARLHDAATKYDSWLDELPDLQDAPDDPDALAREDEDYQEAGRLQEKADEAVREFAAHSAAYVTGLIISSPTLNRPAQ